MNYTVLIIIILIALGLRADFKRDIGLHKKAKIYHTIILYILVWFFSGSSSFILYFLQDFNKTLDIFSKDIGVFSGTFIGIAYLVNSFLSLFVFFLLFRLIARKRACLIKLYIILPILAITNTIIFYVTFISSANNIDYSDTGILFIGILLFGIPTLFILLMYRKKIMVDFFALQRTKE